MSNTVFSFFIDINEEVEDTAEIVIGETPVDIVGPMVQFFLLIYYFTFNIFYSDFTEEWEEEKEKKSGEHKCGNE